jgi:hypothetical protein
MREILRFVEEIKGKKRYLEFWPKKEGFYVADNFSLILNLEQDQTNETKPSFNNSNI